MHTRCACEAQQLACSYSHLCCPAGRAQCSFFEMRQYKIIYRRYASLFFMAGVDDDEVREAQQQQQQL